MRKFDINITSDAIINETKKHPKNALAELIWNSLDADATDVVVQFPKGELGDIDIVISDNGSGIHYDEVEKLFSNYGGSWKRHTEKTNGGRNLHGNYGKGRLYSIVLGKTIVWNTTYKSKDGYFYNYKIKMVADNPKSFEISESIKVKVNHTGTIVTINDLRDNSFKLRDEKIFHWFNEMFCHYLNTYNAVRIFYNEEEIRPELLLEIKAPIIFGINFNDTIEKVVLTIYEWKKKTEKRTLFICNKQGFVFYETSMPYVSAPGFDFSARLRSEHLYKHYLDNPSVFTLEDMDDDIHTAKEEIKKQLRQYFRKRSAEQSKSFIEELKRIKAYPFTGEPENAIEEIERDTFDVVAASMTAVSESFNKKDDREKRISLDLIRKSLEDGPDEFNRVIKEVIDLSPTDIKTFADLLEKISLSDMLKANNLIIDRLTFLRSLEILLFEPKSEKQWLERSQMHKVLEKKAWLFGEEYALSASDDSLTVVLKKHRQHLDRVAFNDEDGVPVLREDGLKGIIDLMFSTIYRINDSKNKHLIVELKRPGKRLDSKDENQIISYAFAIIEDDRFKHGEVEWEFWLVGNSFTKTLERKLTTQRDKYLIFEDPEKKVKIIAKPFGVILDECKSRLSFFGDKLQYNATRSEGLEALREIREKYLPDVIREELAAKTT